MLIAVFNILLVKLFAEQANASVKIPLILELCAATCEGVYSIWLDCLDQESPLAFPLKELKGLLAQAQGLLWQVGRATVVSLTSM